MPTSKSFQRFVNEYEKIWSLEDCIYDQAIEKFSKIELDQLNEEDEKKIIRPFLLKWGKMGRVLGFNGVTAIRKKLKTIDNKITPLRKTDLLSAKLDRFEKQIIGLFDEVCNTKFRSKKGKRKRVGPTATSKTLHLTCPNLFVIWDKKIRSKNKVDDKKITSNGIGYFKFLSKMEALAQKKNKTIKKLQNKYQKSVTKILDQYNMYRFYD